MAVTVHHGDCLAVLPTLPANSVDGCLTDPPYHLTSIVKRFGAENAAPAKDRDGLYARASRGFMGKQWDGGDIAFRPETWAAVYRVLKPGAHLIAFSGSRTYHRMACAIEDAGFEIRDQIMWLYGSGFAKSHNLRNKPICDCESGTNPVPYDHDKQTPEHHLRPVQGPDLSASLHSSDQRREVLFEGLPEQGAQERGTARPQSEASAAEQSGVERRPLRGAGQGLRDDLDAGSSEGSEERLCVRAHPRGGEDARAGSSAGRGSAPREPGSGGQSAGEPEGVREPSGALDGGALRGRGICPQCGKLRKEFEGWGTALKPAHEPILVARKPLVGTVAQNMAMHGTGAINIDGCRVEGDAPAKWQTPRGGIWKTDPAARAQLVSSDLGRWPANVIHDGSDEVLDAFPETASGTLTPDMNVQPSTGWSGGSQADRVKNTFSANAGSAARFFYSSKASKSDRVTRDVEEVEVEWISENGPCRVRLQVDTGQSPRKAIVVSGLEDASEWSMFLSGSAITALYQKATKCIIETATNSTIELRTWSFLTRSLISGCTADASCVAVFGGNHAESAAKFGLSATITLGETVSLPGANRALSQTLLRISVSAKRHSHPTTKPIDLIAYLARLITPVGGTILDPFAGSGTLATAALREGFNAILIEREAEYIADIQRRLAHVAGEDSPLFAGSAA